MVDQLVAAGYAVATLLSAAVGWRSLRARPRPGATWLAFTMVGVVWWSTLSVGLALTPDLVGPLGTLLGRLEWFGIAVIAVGMARFGLAMSGRDDVLSNRAVAALLAVPFAWTVVGLSHAKIIGLAAATVPPLAVFLRAIEPLVPLYVWLNPLVVAGVYLALAIGTVALLETAFERPAADPSRLLLLAMVLPPWTLNVLYLAELTPTGGYDPTVLGFVVTGVVGVAAIDRFRLFESPFVRSEIVEELDTPVVAFGADDRLYDYNARAASLLELGEADLDEPLDVVLERSPLAVDVPRDAPLATVADRLDGTAVTAETADGGERHFLVTTTRLARGDGRQLGYAVLWSDVTRQRRQQNRIREKSRHLERKNEQLERLASIVAHDMETPVATGRRLLDLVRFDVDTANGELERSLDDLDRVFGRLEAFAEHLPRLARESVDVEMTVECDLETVARDAWRVVDTGDLELRVVDTTTVAADPRRLQQVFENLFRNAAEHGSAGAVTDGTRPANERCEVDVADRTGRGSTDPTDSHGTSDTDRDPPLDPQGPGVPGSDTEAATAVTVGTLDGDAGSYDRDRRGFYVEDDGPGIPVARRDDVFSFGVSDDGGSGYGLAIVRTIIEAHGWSIRVTDAIDPGADPGNEPPNRPRPGTSPAEDRAATGPGNGASGARFEVDFDV